MRVSIVIMAHRKRQAWAEELSSALNCPIVYDEKNNVWDTCRRSWLAIDKDADYGLVIQDDAILCEDFLHHLNYMLYEGESVSGDARIQGRELAFVYALYVGSQGSIKIKKALEEGKKYFLSETILNEVALCMKTNYIDSMVKYCDERDAQKDDEISNWARANRLKIFNTVPSLIDHRDEHSIYRENYFGDGKKTKPRKAFRFIDGIIEA